MNMIKKNGKSSKQKYKPILVTGNKKGLRSASYKKCISALRANVYDTDKEIAETVKHIPNDMESIKRYRSYLLIEKK